MPSREDQTKKMDSRIVATYKELPFQEITLRNLQTAQSIILHQNVVAHFLNQSQEQKSNISDHQPAPVAEKSLQKEREEEKPLQNTNVQKSNQGQEGVPNQQPLKVLSRQEYKESLKENLSKMKKISKNIFCYVKKNNKVTKQILKKIKIPEKQFFDFIKSNYKKQTSLKKMKELWTQEIFGKALRTLSTIYLEKYISENPCQPNLDDYRVYLQEVTNVDN